MGAFREFKKTGSDSASQSNELKAAYAAIAGLSEQVATLTETVAKMAASSTSTTTEGGATK
jgi:phage host-nuclease inhibitor protein Gam